MAECSKPPSDDRCKYSDESAKMAVKQVFAILGIDVDDPEKVEEFRKDLRFGQDLRKARDKGVVAVAVALSLSILGFVAAGIIDKLRLNQ